MVLKWCGSGIENVKYQLIPEESGIRRGKTREGDAWDSQAAKRVLGPIQRSQQSHRQPSKANPT
jgi:hypothetical protein